MRLVTHIKAIHTQSRQTYGSPRVYLDLVAQGFQVGLNRVAKLMRRHGIFSVRKRRWKRTTNSNHDLKVSPNLVQRHFDVKAPNKVWAADLTYIWTTAGWLYLAVVMDLFSRRIVGWAMDNHMRTDLAADALKMAISSRQDTHGTIHHSDRGSQYASNDYQGLLREHGLICSMSRKGDCWDNAVVESFFATLKSELVFHRSWNNRRVAISEIFEYLEVFYNRRRRHSTVDGLSPVDYENAFACTKRAA
jgi:putative transposase